MKRIVLVTHSERANPGKVREALHARGCTTEVRYSAGGATLPPMNGGRLEGFDAAVVFGGAMSARDVDEHEFLRAETAWIAEQLAADAPLLGVAASPDAQLDRRCSRGVGDESRRADAAVVELLAERRAGGVIADDAADADFAGQGAQVGGDVGGPAGHGVA